MALQVVIWSRVACDYRGPFFTGLETALRRQNVRLTVLTGTPWPEESHSSIIDQLPFGVRCVNHRCFGGAYISFMPQELKRADLLILEQSNSALHLYGYLLRRMAGRKRPLIAFWGHGSNRMIPNRSIRNLWKFFWLKRVDWWFAYTEGCARLVEQQGFPREKTTVHWNTVDCASLQSLVRSIRRSGTDSSVGAGAPRKRVGLYCGRLVGGKAIGFLLEAAQRIRQGSPSFSLIVIGAGPESERVRAFASENPWCRWVGALYGDARAPFFAEADVLLNPGYVGLSIVEGFAAGLPIVTTSEAHHSPEIEYLNEGKNGVMTASTPSDYAKEVVALLNDDARLEGMQDHAAATYERYGMSAMVESFHDGIMSALAPLMPSGSPIEGPADSERKSQPT